MDWEGLKQTVKTAVRVLDNVIEVNQYPLPQIAKMSRGNRRVGLGVMGFADALIKLGVPYDSDRALELAGSMMEWVDRHAWDASRDLAAERGVYANFEGSRHESRKDRVRNATVTTIAPTGTISIIAGSSGGIEPLFAVAFMRRQADMEMPEVTPAFVRIARERGFYSEELIDLVARGGTLAGIREVPTDVRQLFVTSGEISPEVHVRMQAAFQRHTSMGISKTINMPHEASKEDVEAAFMLAYTTGCKGIAVYRDGSRDAQVLSTGRTGSADTPGPRSPEEIAASLATGNFFEDFMSHLERSEDPTRELNRLLPHAEDRLKGRLLQAAGSRATPNAAPNEAARPTTLAQARNGRPRTLAGVTKKLTTGHGPLYVTMNDDEFGPRECFVLLGKPGGTAAAFSDALGRMISLAEKHGASAREIVHQLRGIQDGHPAGLREKAVLSVPDGVAKAFAEHYLAAEAAPPEQAVLPIVGACPDCGAELVPESGCSVCNSCGYSRCS